MPIKQLSQSKSFVPPDSKPDWLTKIDVLRSLRLHKLLAAVVAVTVIVLGLGFRARHHNTYASTSVVYVSPNFPATLKVAEEQEYPYDSFIEEQVHSVTGAGVLTDALKKLPPYVWRYPNESMEGAVERLQHMLTVKRDGLSYQVQISLTGTDPTHLADIVNAVTNTYLDATQDAQFYGRDKRLEALRQERAQVQSDLTAKLQAQTEINKNLGLARITVAGTDSIDDQVSKLRTDLSVAHGQRIQAEAQLTALHTGGVNSPNAALQAAAEDIVNADPSVLALKSSLSSKRALLLDQLAGMTANHPLRKATEQQLTEIEHALQQMQASLRDHAAAELEQKLRTEMLRASTVEAKLAEELASNTRQAAQAAPAFQRSQVLSGDILALQTRYDALDERTRNLELESKSPGPVHLFSAAQNPNGPLPSIVQLVPIVIFPFAVFLGIATAVMVDYLDSHVYTVPDVEQLFGFSPLGALFDNQDVSMQVFEEGVLRMAGGIDQAARTAGVRTIVVTAVTAEAGTTTIVEDLGGTLAKLGRKALTIDASGVTPPVAYVTLHPAAHHAVGSGMNGNKQAVELRSSAVTAQPLAPQLTPLTNLTGQAFKDLTMEYDVVLIDAAPILLSAETEYLARFADVTILVTEAGVTKKAQLVRAARLLERLQIPGMAVALNKIRYSRINRATQDDVSAFESRMEQNAKWNSAWNGEAPSPDYESEQPAEEKSTYA